MNKKVLIPMAVVTCGLAALSVFLKLSLDSAERDLDKTRDELQAEKRERKIQYTNFTQRIGEYDDRINELQKIEREFTRTRDDLEKLKAALTEKENALKAGEKKAGELAARVKKLTEERDKALLRLQTQLKLHDELLPELTKAKEKADKLAKELENVRNEKAALEEKLTVAQAERKKLKQELDKFRSLAPQLTGTEIVGRVEEKIGPDKLIISELNQPPKVGLEFSVFRENEFIARARVYRVFEKYAGARITFLQRGKQVQPGDAVKTGF